MLGFGCPIRFPVAVPEKIIGLTLFLDFFDRGHSLRSLDSATGGAPIAPPRWDNVGTKSGFLCDIMVA